MLHGSIIVRAAWDEEARVWTASTTDIDGLAVEGPSLEALRPKVMGAIADLLELNEVRSDLQEIPVLIIAEQSGRVANPRFDGPRAA
jgi:hypothetical protein